MSNLVTTQSSTELSTTISGTAVIARAVEAIFGKPVIVNVWRAALVESMIDLVLSSDWIWCSADYATFNFQHTNGTRLEVKQSAARQSWTKPGASPSQASFDIATRLGTWDGPTWVPNETPRRQADPYVLAHHPVADETANHRDPQQWTFYVVPTSLLPATRSIALGKVLALAKPVGYRELTSVIEQARAVFQSARDGHAGHS